MVSVELMFGFIVFMVVIQLFISFKLQREKWLNTSMYILTLLVLAFSFSYEIVFYPYLQVFCIVLITLFFLRSVFV